jgi:hypothetical protein
MPAIVEFPQVVSEAVAEFGDLFSCEPQRRHFAEYLTGLMVREYPSHLRTGFRGHQAHSSGIGH